MIQITADKIDLTALLPLVSHPDCGAQVMFVGTTRQWTGEVETEFLYYETYEQLARAKMSELEQAARMKWPVREVVLCIELVASMFQNPVSRCSSRVLTVPKLLSR